MFGNFFDQNPQFLIFSLRKKKFVITFYKKGNKLNKNKMVGTRFSWKVMKYTLFYKQIIYKNFLWKNAIDNNFLWQKVSGNIFRKNLENTKPFQISLAMFFQKTFLLD